MFVSQLDDREETKRSFTPQRALCCVKEFPYCLKLDVRKYSFYLFILLLSVFTSSQSELSHGCFSLSLTWWFIVSDLVSLDVFIMPNFSFLQIKVVSGCQNRVVARISYFKSDQNFPFLGLSFRLALATPGNVKIDASYEQAFSNFWKML